MVERHLAKVDVAGSSPVFRSNFKTLWTEIVWGNDEQVPELIWISEEYSDKIDTVRKVDNNLSICGYRISANTPAFQAGKVGSIPTTRSIRQLNVSCLFYFPNKSKLINIQYCNGNNKSLI